MSGTKHKDIDFKSVQYPQKTCIIIKCVTCFNVDYRALAALVKLFLKTDHLETWILFEFLIHKKKCPENSPILVDLIAFSYYRSRSSRICAVFVIKSVDIYKIAIQRIPWNVLRINLILDIFNEEFSLFLIMPHYVKLSLRKPVKRVAVVYFSYFFKYYFWIPYPVGYVNFVGSEAYIEINELEIKALHLMIAYILHIIRKLGYFNAVLNLSCQRLKNNSSIVISPV